MLRHGLVHPQLHFGTALSQQFLQSFHRPSKIKIVVSYDCLIDDETGERTINEYDYRHQLVETHGAAEVEIVIEKLEDALSDTDLKKYFDQSLPLHIL